MKFQIGDEIVYSRDGYKWLGIVTDTTPDTVYILLGHSHCVMGTEERYLKATGAKYGDFAEALACLKERQLCVEGKLVGWRDIMPKENIIDPDEGISEYV